MQIQTSHRTQKRQYTKNICIYLQPPPPPKAKTAVNKSFLTMTVWFDKYEGDWVEEGALQGFGIYLHHKIIVTCMFKPNYGEYPKFAQLIFS